jgi:hypothetical protein
MLVKACTAVAKTMLDQDQTLAPLQSTTLTTDFVDTYQMRRVALKFGTADDPDDAVHYECLFEETFGFLNTSYTASLYRITNGEKTIGKKGGEIEGDLQDFIKLQDTTGAILHQ